MPEPVQRWSICPIEDCEHAQEYDSQATAVCPECGMELLSECPACQTPLMSDTQTTCTNCGASLKE